MDKAQLLLDGFCYGFRLGYVGPRVACWAENLRSAKELPDVVWRKLLKEMRESRMEGPFRDWPLPTLRISPIGVVLKKEQDEFR